MTTHKAFKQQVRARMARTGEAYTTARQQLLRRAGQAQDAPAATRPDASATTEADRAIAPPPQSDQATVRATGRNQAEWYALIDAEGPAADGHTAIARWLASEHGVSGWWSQSITVGYERARGLRAKGQMRDGFTVSATKTIAAEPERILDAFATPGERNRWLPAVSLSPRRTTARHTARFDWADPPSRIVVWAIPRRDGRTTVTVSHEKLPDAEVAERTKTQWRARLVALARILEARGQPGSDT